VTKMVGAAIPMLRALGCLTVSIRHFLHRGAPWNNAWIYASETERQQMDAAPYYRQSGVVFSLLCALFAALALEVLLSTGWLRAAVAVLTAAALVYAIVSTVKIERNNSQPGK